MKARELKRDNYTVRIGYSKKAKKEKLLKFILNKGKSFEVSAEELSSMLISGVNNNTLEATFVESDSINVVEVGRQLECVLDKDMKKGEKLLINYVHPYPLEFAVLEQVYGIARINMDVPAITLSKEYIEETRKKIKPKQENFIKKFYKAFKNLKLDEK